MIIRPLEQIPLLEIEVKDHQFFSAGHSAQTDLPQADSSRDAGNPQQTIRL